MAQSVIVKKDEKIAKVISLLPDRFTENDFIALFQTQYPKEWKRIESVYKQHERKTKPGKKHPMPEPRRYLINALKVWKKKQSET